MIPLSYAQRGLWFLQQFGDAGAAYNVPMAWHRHHWPATGRAQPPPRWHFPSREGISIHFMAQRIQTLLIDDLDGGEAASTVRFGLDGAEYEIDLSAAHNDELRKELQQYLEHARRTGTAKTAARTRRGSAAVDTAKVREWAKEQGIEVKDRGRVPANVVEQYRTAAGA